MKRALPFTCALLMASAPAWAVDVRLLGAADVLLATGPDGGQISDAELGLTLRADVREVARRVDFKLDFAGREAFVGNTSYNNLYELSANAKALVNGRLDVKVGRIRTPGGFWLIADGGMLTVHYTSWLSQSVYGGLRSFTTGRRNTWMDASPLVLPLAGTSVQVNHRIVQGSLSFTWARDGIDDRSELLGKNILRIEDEYFLDGQVVVYPHDKVYLSGGASLGTRYDVLFDTVNPTAPTNISVATLGSVSAFAIAEYRPIKRLRLQYSFNYERVRLFQSKLLTLTPAGTQVTAAGGSFQDHNLRAVALVWRALRAELAYRLRFRANTDIEHHLTLGVRGDDLWRGLGGFAQVGVDVNQGLDVGIPDPTAQKIHNRVLYSVGASFVRQAPFGLDVRAGISFTDGIGSGLVFSSPSATNAGRAPTDLFPYLLETNRIAFVRAFTTFWKMFAGLDVEENLDHAQLRMLLQVGAAL
jgi:hypothetical protein